jgi:hypothetical protein
LCGEIDERVNAFLIRPIEGDWPYLWIDATCVKSREAVRVAAKAVNIAVAVNTEGVREVLGMAVNPFEAETFWSQFLRSLTRRGLRGVKLVISDAHALRTHGWRRGRRLSLHGLPEGASHADPHDQSAGEAQRRDKAENQCRRHLRTLQP